ncbi:hypothetical protein Nepgr_010463 [Nepenthes gracilis]|uniref:Uncharacterized protein n=1 Tax=Nepenthes gracilis TaxID=150966 RepID=A0AAD3XL27_NEPGR|nr:hypothetical protein Nepgr_010463 [Nepenthes gracilis]
MISTNWEESVVEVEVEFQGKHLRRSSCWKGGQNATQGKTMMEFHPTGWKLENPHSKLVPPSSNRNKPKGSQQSSHRAASKVCSSNPFAVLQSDAALSTTDLL